MPRPVFVSILFYIVLLTVLLEANRSGKTRILYWLPAMFLVWANIHIQFVYGLFVLGLFVACQVALRWAEGINIAPAVPSPAPLPVTPLALTFGACVLATLISPYSYHLYQVVFLYSKAKYSYEIIRELQPLTLITTNQLVQLFLTAAGFCAVGWRKKTRSIQASSHDRGQLSGFRTPQGLLVRLHYRSRVHCGFVRA